MNWLAIDIGGANLKVADGRDFADSVPFALWEHPDRLAHELRVQLAAAPRADHLAITMTGELADCFQDRREGVAHILDSVEQASDRRHTRVFLLDETLVSPRIARQRPLEAASSNWLALAKFAGRFAKTGPALLIDVGSTTIDVIPLRDGRPGPAALTDRQRMVAGELIYTGVERSPICAVMHDVEYRGQRCPLAQELFATTLDAYVTLGKLPENATRRRTADGTPMTRAASQVRLRRAICAGADEFSAEDALAMARQVMRVQVEMLVKSLLQVRQQLNENPATIVLSGHGEFLARDALDQLPWDAKLISLTEELGPTVSRCAPAHALAVIARDA